MKGFVWVPKALLNFQQIVGVEKWPGGGGTAIYGLYRYVPL